jgi:hypothetical protein
MYALPMMNKRNARFAKGSGCFTCAGCKRQTRSTGDNGYSGLCPECYEIAGQENALSDNGPDWAYAANATAEIERLKAACRAKGGQL